MEKQRPQAKDGVTEGIPVVGYAVNDDGEYELVSGPGWQPVDIVNRQAWKEIEKHIELSKRKIASGRVSCLHYYMTANQMDIGLLAAYTNQSRLRVRLHLLPFFFKRLGPDTLEKYAALFQVSRKDLKIGRLKPPVYETAAREQRSHD